MSGFQIKGAADKAAERWNQLPLLVTKGQGPTWFPEAIDTLKVNRYGSLLSREKDKPVQKTGEDLDDFTDRLYEWQDKQE